MSKKSYVIACSKLWDHDIISKLKKSVSEEASWFLITNQNDLTVEYLKKVDPKYVFFPHWSYLIPDSIFNQFECIIFHMTDLPYGRGGSPLQNLISKKVTQTKISALKCVKEVDAGPIYLKRSLSLTGSAQQIYIRAAKIIRKMILDIVQTNPVPQAQTGDVTVFKRRKPSDSRISELLDIASLYDHIRMLDAEGYPKAFLEHEGFRYEFSNASHVDGKLTAKVSMSRVNETE